MTTSEMLARLCRAEVKMVTAYYGGSGDEGYLNDFDFDPSPRIRSVADPGGIEQELWDELETHIEDILYHIISSRVGGYEINEGGGGTLIVDVAAGKATLKHYDNVISEEWQDPVTLELS
jgi:hypothetical protein